MVSRLVGDGRLVWIVEKYQLRFMVIDDICTDGDDNVSHAECIF